MASKKRAPLNDAQPSRKRNRGRAVPQPVATTNNAAPVYAEEFWRGDPPTTSEADQRLSRFAGRIAQEISELVAKVQADDTMPTSAAELDALRIAHAAIVMVSGARRYGHEWAAMWGIGAFSAAWNVARGGSTSEAPGVAMDLALGSFVLLVAGDGCPPLDEYEAATRRMAPHFGVAFQFVDSARLDGVLNRTYQELKRQRGRAFTATFAERASVLLTVNTIWAAYEWAKSNGVESDPSVFRFPLPGRPRGNKAAHNSTRLALLKSFLSPKRKAPDPRPRLRSPGMF